MYDNDVFFQKYSAFPRAIQGEKGASEWPELQRMLPKDYSGKKVLDLACGEGWFARWCVARGALEVDACDISVNMLRKAESRTMTAKSPSDKLSPPAAVVQAARGSHPVFVVVNDDDDDAVRAGTGMVHMGGPYTEGIIHFSRVDMESLVLPTASAYDLVFCGLALHYVVNIENVIQQVHSSLAPGGLFVFSIEHPFLTAPTRPGFTKTADGQVDQWPVDSYFDQGERSVHWLVRDVKKQHRTISRYFELLVMAGFEVQRMDEWGATEQKTRKHPDWVEGVTPRFLLMTARKKGEKARSPLRNKFPQLLRFSSQ